MKTFCYRIRRTVLSRKSCWKQSSSHSLRKHFSNFIRYFLNFEVLYPFYHFNTHCKQTFKHIRYEASSTLITLCLKLIFDYYFQTVALSGYWHFGPVVKYIRLVRWKLLVLSPLCVQPRNAGLPDSTSLFTTYKRLLMKWKKRL